jgi:thiosulfate dehydrogenase [quinone] large subunit
VLFVLMAILMYGVTIVQNWDSASSQLIYNIVLFILLAGVGYNRFALDNIWFQRDRSAQPESTAATPTSVMRSRWGESGGAQRQRKYRISAFWLKG